jgi:TrfA protein
VTNLDTTLQRQLSALEKKSTERGLSKDILLPECHDAKRGTPNGFLRSALFSAIQSKDRVWMKDALLASQEGIAVKFTGEQLNQEDLTLWETLVHLSKENTLGSICEFTAYQILKSLQINTGKAEYDRLEKGIDRLTACQVKITFNGKTFSRSLIIGYEKLEATSYYRLELSRDLIKLYGKNDWTAIDWDQRLTLRKKPLAQALHGYYSSHKSPFPVKLIFLQRLTGSKNKQAASFKRQVVSALEELVKIDFLESYSINDDKVTVKRK